MRTALVVGMGVVLGAVACQADEAKIRADKLLWNEILAKMQACQSLDDGYVQALDTKEVYELPLEFEGKQKTSAEAGHDTCVKELQDLVSQL